MLATSRCSDFTSLLPAIPSPLSPRSANIYGRSRPGMASSDKPGMTKEEPWDVATRDRGLRKRSPAKAPSPRQDELKERRRSMFLRNVRQGREDKRFEARGEDIMRLDFVQRQKQWEARQAREAPSLPSGMIEEAAEDATSRAHGAIPASTLFEQQSMPRDEVDEVVRREDEELEALLAYMPPLPDTQHTETMDSNTRSDQFENDDDYDALFAEVIQQENRAVHQQSSHESQVGDEEEAMDLT